MFYIFRQSKASGPNHAHVAEKAVGDERAEPKGRARRARQARAGGRVRGPRPPDRVPRPARAGRTGRPVADRAPAGGVRPGGREVGHAAGRVQPPDHGRPEPERAAVGHAGARARHRQRSLDIARRIRNRRRVPDADRPRRPLLDRTAMNLRRNTDKNGGGDVYYC